MSTASCSRWRRARAAIAVVGLALVGIAGMQPPALAAQSTDALRDDGRLWEVGAGVEFGPFAATAQGAVDRNGSLTEMGHYFSGGLALRWKRLVVEQHLLFLQRADEAVPENRQYFPVTVTVRF